MDSYFHISDNQQGDLLDIKQIWDLFDNYAWHWIKENQMSWPIWNKKLFSSKNFMSDFLSNQILLSSTWQGSVIVEKVDD